jgi:hypothetical protein
LFPSKYERDTRDSKNQSHLAWNRIRFSLIAGRYEGRGNALTFEARMALAEMIRWKEVKEEECSMDL